jgi:hypothetical protein
VNLVGWLSWHWAILPPWGKLAAALVAVSMMVQVVDLLFRSTRLLLLGLGLLMLFGMCSCAEGGMHVLVDDAGAVHSVDPISLDGGVEVHVVCGPSPITIDYGCGWTEGSAWTCMKASGLAQTPCEFQGGWLVDDCSQCWGLR